MTCKKARENQDSHRALYAHAQTIILTLRAELESERTAHAHTRQQTESEILSLSARLARREAELEACVAQAHVHPPAEGPPIKDSYSAPSGPSEHAGPARRADFMGVAGNGLDAHSSSSQRSTSTLTQDDAVQILDFSASRNRALEAEVRVLLERVSVSLQAMFSKFAVSGACLVAVRSDFAESEARGSGTRLCDMAFVSMALMLMVCSSSRRVSRGARFVILIHHTLDITTTTVTEMSTWTNTKQI